MSNSAWYAGLSEQEKQELKASLAAARPALDRLAQILEKKKTIIEDKRTSRSCYFMPAWKQYQADCNGNIRALKETLQLIT